MNRISFFALLAALLAVLSFPIDGLVGIGLGVAAVVSGITAIRMIRRDRSGGTR